VETLVYYRKNGTLVPDRAVVNRLADIPAELQAKLAKVPLGSFINRANDRIISMEDYAKLLDACPNQDWRTLIALARIGGLRFQN